jgi:dolichyl-phosphate-mannose-protein mannosyltransferase
MGLKGSFNRLKSFNEGLEKTVVRVTRPRTSSRKMPRWLAPVLILGLSFFVHLFRLGEPREVVFDEVHFGKFISAYCCNKERFFDIHPPHAKLLTAGAAALGGFRGNFTFDRIGQPYGGNSPWALRWLSALMGALLPFLVWMLLRQLGASRPAAFLGGFALALDNALLVQSRMMGLDSTLLLSLFGGLSLFLHSLKRGTTRRSLWMMAAGAVGGLAVGSKLTGLSLFLVMGLVVFRPFLSRRNRDNFRFGARASFWIAAGAIPVYVAGFLLHFALLTKSGPGDRFFKPTASVVDNVIGLQKVMLSANYFLTKTHPASSRWWEWPLGKKPIFYWVSGERSIYLWGNPVLWWGTTLLLVVILGATALGRVTSLAIAGGGEPKSRALQWIPFWGFVFSFAPLAFVPRALFLYHYFTPLVFAVLYVILWLDGAEWIVSSRLLKQRKSYYAVALLLLVGFLAVSPVSYGTTAPMQWHIRLATFLQSLR